VSDEWLFMPNFFVQHAGADTVIVWAGYSLSMVLNLFCAKDREGISKAFCEALCCAVLCSFCGVLFPAVGAVFVHLRMNLESSTLWCSNLHRLLSPSSVVVLGHLWEICQCNCVFVLAGRALIWPTVSDVTPVTVITGIH